MKKRISLFFAFVLIFTLSLSGCGGSGSFSSQYAAAETMAETAAAAMGYDLGFDSSNSMAMAPAAAPVPMEAGAMEEEIAWEEDAVPMEGSMPDTSPQELPSVSDSAPIPLERKLIRNMDLTVETTDFDPLINALQTKVAEFEGYIEQSDISGDSITNQGRPSKKYAHMTLRIPADKLDSFVSQVEAAGNITYKSENVSDVTLQYSDIQSRLKTLRMEQERLWELLGKADTTEAIVLLEERLTEVSSEIESYESRMRYLDNSVTYSTVYLSIQEVDIESPTKPETAWQQIQRGFTRNLIALMDNLTQFFIEFLSHLPVILFLALLVLAVVWIVRRISRRRKEKKQKNIPISPIPVSHYTPKPEASGKQKQTNPEEASHPTEHSGDSVHPDNEHPGNSVLPNNEHSGDSTHSDDKTTKS